MSRGTKILIVFDGVDAIDQSFGAHTLDWLPKYLPPGVRPAAVNVLCGCVGVKADRDP